MKIKSKKSTSSPSAFVQGVKCAFVTLLILNVIVIIVLVPMYSRLLKAEKNNARALSSQQGSSENDAQQHHPKVDMVMVQQQTEPQPEQEQSPLQMMRRRNTNPSRGMNDINGLVLPFIGKDEFHKKYSTKYKGIIPSSKRQSSDPSCGKNPDFFDFFQLPKTQRSRFHEDKIIYDLFKNNTILSSSSSYPHGEESSSPPSSSLPKGTYLELGAFDGKDESNTMFFDKCLGWDGLLIEAQRQSYEKVVEHRPHAFKLSFSPTCTEEDDVTKFYDYPLSNNGMEGLAKSYTGKETIDVPCGPLTPVLLDIFGPDNKLNFFSLDVEGAELMVLQTLDFDVLHIEVLMVEIQNSYCPEANCPNVHAIRHFMAKTGKYALFVDFLEASDVYVRWGTEVWKRALQIQRTRKELLEREMREAMERERQQLIG